MAAETHGKKKHNYYVEHHDGHGGDHGGEEGWLVSYADMMTLLVGFFVILLSFSQVDQEKFEEVKKSAVKEFGGKYEKPFEDLSSRVMKAVEKNGLGGEISIIEKGATIEISILGPVLFETGQADLKPEAQKILNDIVPILKNQIKEFDVTVEGHTDDVPMSNAGFMKNNWELSGMRASRVLQQLIEDGIEKTKLTAIGYGDSKPLVPNRSSNGTAIVENQAKNRRVVLKLKRVDHHDE